MSSLHRSVIGLVLLVAPMLAGAQLHPLYEQFDVNAFHPRPMAECSLTVGCAETGPAGALRLAAAAVYSSKPLVAMADGTVGGGGFGGGVSLGSIIAVRYGLDLLAAWVPRDGLELHAELPVFVLQSGDSLSYLGVASPGAWGTGTPSLGVRWSALSQRHGAPLALALALDLSPPVGWKDALAGNAGWMAGPRLELANWFDVGVVALEVGGELRRSPVRVGAGELRHRVTWGLGVAGRSVPLRAEAVIRGISAGQMGNTAIEVLLGCRYAREAYEVFFMAGPGYRNAIGFGEVRAMAGIAWGRSMIPVMPEAPTEPPERRL